MKSHLDLLGQWPVPGAQARREKQITVIRKNEGLDLIHGKDNHILVSFFVSNDFLHVGTMTIPANGLSDFEVHKGDEVIYVIEGAVSLLVQEDRGGKAPSLSRTRTEARKGERLLVPEGYRHQYFNSGEGAAKLLFTIAPGL